MGDILNDRVSIVQSETRIDELLELLSKGVHTVETLERDIENTIDNIDDMTPLEVGLVVGSIESRVSEIADIVAIDLESLSPDDIYYNSRIELESMMDTIKDKFNSLINVFKSTRTLLSDAVDKAKKVWTVTNTKRIEEATAKLSKIAKDAKPSKEIDFGKKLSTAMLLKLTPSDIVGFANGLVDMNPDKAGNSVVDKKTRDYVSKYQKIDSGIKFKVSRIDSDSIAMITLAKIENVNSYTGYFKTEIAPDDADKLDDSVYNNIKYAKDLLAAAKDVNYKVVELGNKLLSEVDEVSKMAKKPTKWMSNAMNTGIIAAHIPVAFPNGASSVSKMSGTAIAKAGTMMSDASKAKVGTAVNTVKNVASSASKVYTKATAAGVGKVAGKIARFVASPLIATPTMPLMSTAMVALSAYALIYDNFISKPDLEDLNSDDLKKVLLARAEMTARYGKDAMYGLAKLTDEMISVAETIIDNHTK